MLKAILIDDEAHALEALGQLLELYHPALTVAASCNTMPAAVQAIQLHKPDLILLDIDLGQESGFDLFKHFPNPAFSIIFITAHNHYAVQAFRFAALDYLMKPVSSALLAEAIEKATHAAHLGQISLKIDSFFHNKQHDKKAGKRIILNTAEKIHLVALEEIMYCEADRGYTVFYLADNSRIVVSKTMGDYEELFTGHDFFRIHQSYLLNLNYFKAYEKADGGKAVLKNGMGLPVATRKKDLLLQNLARF